MTRRSLSALLLSLAALLPLPAAQAEALDPASAKKLFNERGCNACHEVDEQKIGPPYRAVALRYSAEYEQDAAARIEALALKIRYGGAGAWGYVPMISNPAIDAEEAKQIAQWIMDLRNAPATSSGKD